MLFGLYFWGEIKNRCSVNSSVVCIYVHGTELDDPGHSFPKFTWKFPTMETFTAVSKAKDPFSFSCESPPPPPVLCKELQTFWNLVEELHFLTEKLNV